MKTTANDPFTSEFQSLTAEELDRATGGVDKAASTTGAGVQDGDLTQIAQQSGISLGWSALSSGNYDLLSSDEFAGFTRSLDKTGL